jgi:two-component system response regulator RegA
MQPPDTTRPLALSVLVVDDDEAFRTRLGKAIRSRGYDVREADGATSAAVEAGRESPEMAVVDLRLPDGTGLDVVRELRRLDPSTRIVVLTGYGSIATALEAVRLGAVNYLTKPVDADRVLAAFDPEGAPSPEPQADTPSLARVEWEHINRVLADCGGNISEAARVLGVHRRSLQRKLQKFPTAR